MLINSSLVDGWADDIFVGDFYVWPGIVLCLLLGLVSAGLTMGLASLEPFDLQIVLNANEDDCESEEERRQLHEEKKHAARILPLINRHHVLMVTMILLNTLANEALPLFLNSVFNAWTTLLLSVFVVLFFGEVLPSAIFTGRHQLPIAAAFAPLVWVLIYVLYPLVWPISWLLAQALGQEHKGRYNKAELKALINLHGDAFAADGGAYGELPSSPRGFARTEMDAAADGRSETVSLASAGSREKKHHYNNNNNNNNNNTHLNTVGSSPRSRAAPSPSNNFMGGALKFFPTTNKSPHQSFVDDRHRNNNNHHQHQHHHHQPAVAGLTRQELRIMQGAMELHRLAVKDVLLPLDSVFMLSSATVLDGAALAEIVAKGHSRIPVFEEYPHNVRGMLLVKRLVELNPEHNRTIASVELLEPLVVAGDCSLLDLLYEFAKGRSHLALVCNDPHKLLGAWAEGRPVPVDVHMAGIVTLEDVIEHLIKHEIKDESDTVNRDMRRYKHRERVFSSTNNNNNNNNNNNGVGGSDEVVSSETKEEV